MSDKEIAFLLRKMFGQSVASGRDWMWIAESQLISMVDIDTKKSTESVIRNAIQMTGFDSFYDPRKLVYIFTIRKLKDGFADDTV